MQGSSCIPIPLKTSQAESEDTSSNHNYDVKKLHDHAYTKVLRTCLSVGACICKKER